MSALQATPTQHGIDILNSELKNTVTQFQLIGALTDDAPNESLYVFHHGIIETSYYDENGVLTFIINLPIEQHFNEYLHHIHVLDTQDQSVIECSTPMVALPKGVGGTVTLKVDISGEAGEIIFKHGEFVTEAELLDLYLPLKEDSGNAANNSDIDNESSDLKHIKLPQLWRAFSKKVKNASTTVVGIVKTSNSLTSTRSDEAASSLAVKTLNDKVEGLDDKVDGLKFGFSSGQLWRDYGKVFNVRYTNTQPYPIQVLIVIRPKVDDGLAAIFYIDSGVSAPMGTFYTRSGGYCINCIIPSGAEYWMDASDSTWLRDEWSELL